MLGFVVHTVNGDKVGGCIIVHSICALTRHEVAYVI